MLQELQDAIKSIDEIIQTVQPEDALLLSQYIETNMGKWLRDKGHDDFALNIAARTLARASVLDMMKTFIDKNIPDCCMMEFDFSFEEGYIGAKNIKFLDKNNAEITHQLDLSKIGLDIDFSLAYALDIEIWVRR